MFLKKISIINYKNIREATMELSPRLNCLIGNNGQGKTNFLDAVYYLSFCRSATNPIDSQVITHNQDFFVLEGEYAPDSSNSSDSPDSLSIYCGMKRGTKKHFKRNKKEYKRLSEHIGLIPLVSVSPSDTLLIEGGSEERRRLMDVVIAQYDKSYIESLASYNRALQQRNVLLKQEEEPDAQLLDILELEMGRHGEAVYRARAAFIEQLIPAFQRIYRFIADHPQTPPKQEGTTNGETPKQEGITNGEIPKQEGTTNGETPKQEGITNGDIPKQEGTTNEEVSLRYVSHCQRGSLYDVIHRDRMKDRVVGYSLHGIHRDDLEMLLDGYQMKREGSQGQNKTFVLALKLAQFEFLCHTVSTTTPILLLDDIFDKLDASRVEQIIRLVSGEDYGQIFITDTNRDHLDRILRHSALDYRLFRVEQGEVMLNA